MISVYFQRQLLSVGFFLVSLQLNAAAPPNQPAYPYKCFIKMKGISRLEKGYLYSISDSTIFLARTYKALLMADSLPRLLKKFPINDQLVQVRIRSRASGFVGGVAGLGTGFVIMLLAAKNSSMSFESAVAFGLVAGPLLLVGGSVIGAVVANSGSKAIYNYGSSKVNICEEIGRYSYSNWMKTKKRK